MKKNYFTTLGWNREDESLSAAIVTLIALVIVFFIAPFVAFWSGYLVGIVAKMTIGNSFVLGASKLGLSFKAKDIPLIFGFLNCVAITFCNNSLNFKNKNKN